MIPNGPKSSKRPRIRNGGTFGVWWEGADGRVRVIDMAALPAGVWSLAWDGSELTLVEASSVVPDGHYEPVANGDPDDPQPIYVYDANDSPSFMMVWVTES